ncbi:MAG TPA: acetolactate synthase [Phycisphaerae bacterium]|nr:acetolactate synthase [Phycisphaerae bacterium]
MHVGTQFTVYLINKPGVLAEVTGSLAEAKANIAALALMDSGEHGALRILCDDPTAARDVLTRTSDRWTEAEVLVLELENRPGTFAAVAAKFAAAKINITYAYFSGGRTTDRTIAVFKVPDPKKALKALHAGRQGDLPDSCP